MNFLREYHLHFIANLQRNEAEYIYSMLPSSVAFSTYILEGLDWKIASDFSGTIGVMVGKLFHLPKPLFSHL